jgi:integrase
MMLAKLGLRADEIAALTLDDIDWRAGEMRLRAKGRQQVGMPISPDVGAAVVAYLRDARPKSSCRRLFLRALAPHVGFAFPSAITTIAKTALAHAGVRASRTRGLISFGTASPPSFSGPMRHCRRLASCCDTKVTTQPASMPRWTSIRSGL